MPRLFVKIIIAAGLALAAQTSQAAPFPDGQPVTIVVPFPPGSLTEAGLRLLAPALEKALGAKVDIVTKPGWGGQVGLAEFVHAAPDGHTLAYVPLPNVIELYFDPNRKPGFEKKDFQPVAELWEVPIGLTVPVESPIKDFKQLMEMAKAKPGAVMIADAGLLTPQHMLTGVLAGASGLDLAPIHFTEGQAGANRAMLGGHVDAAADSRTDIIPILDKVRVLAVSGGAPDPLLPGVPTLTSLGMPIAFAEVTGLAAPAGTPATIVAALESALRAALGDSGTVKRLREIGFVPTFKDSNELAAVWSAYDEAVTPVIKAEIK